MTQTETKLFNITLQEGRREGDATPERIGSFLDRRMAQLALNVVTVSDISDEYIEQLEQAS